VRTAAGDISVVVPTLNRADALRANLPSVLELEGVGEIVIVIDSRSTDDTPGVAEAFGDPRVRLERPGCSGLPALRNAGVDATSGAWVLFGEDDCRMPPDYAVRLRSEAIANEAEVAGAPWLHLGEGVDFRAAYEKARSDGGRAPRLDAPGGMPHGALVTPFMPALCIVRRDVFEHVRFDVGYVGNAFREESDFLVRALRHGYRCILTPETASYQVGQWPGGARTSRLRYEWLCVRNNWRFLRIHGDWLRSEGYITGPLRSHAAFVWGRARRTVTGAISARYRRWRS
jgi:glycosyltransferase involved in cell wall biosynthesis